MVALCSGVYMCSTFHDTCSLATCIQHACSMLVLMLGWILLVRVMVTCTYTGKRTYSNTELKGRAYGTVH
jgi:hypothetical protein